MHNIIYHITHLTLWTTWALKCVYGHNITRETIMPQANYPNINVHFCQLRAPKCQTFCLICEPRNILSITLMPHRRKNLLDHRTTFCTILKVHIGLNRLYNEVSPQWGCKLVLCNPHHPSRVFIPHWGNKMGYQKMWVIKKWGINRQNPHHM